MDEWTLNFTHGSEKGDNNTLGDFMTQGCDVLVIAKSNDSTRCATRPNKIMNTFIRQKAEQTDRQADRQTN